MLSALRRGPADRDTELTRAVADAPVLSHLEPNPHGPVDDAFAATGVPTNAAFGCPVQVLAEAVVPTTANNAHVFIMITSTATIVWDFYVEQWRRSTSKLYAGLPSSRQTAALRLILSCARRVGERLLIF